MEKTKHSKEKLKSYILIALFSALICVSSFICIPAPVPFTLQTLAIFSALTVLGGKSGLISIILYIFLGIVGLPVFSGFSSGVGHLLGATGGYISGFIFSALIFHIITRVCGNSAKAQAVALISGLSACYIFGSLWYTAVYLGDMSLHGFLSSLAVCVVPFIVPDLIKIAIAIIISRKLSAYKF